MKKEPYPQLRKSKFTIPCVQMAFSETGICQMWRLFKQPLDVEHRLSLALDAQRFKDFRNGRRRRMERHGKTGVSAYRRSRFDISSSRTGGYCTQKSRWANKNKTLGKPKDASKVSSVIFGTQEKGIIFGERSFEG